MKTPQLSYPKLSQSLQITNEIWLKREDLHHYGSHKGRSIPPMIDNYRREGAANFVISSSGNAALCAILAIKTHNKSKPDNTLKLKIFVGLQIDKSKLEILQLEIANDKNFELTQSENPKQMAMQAEKTTGAKWLRQSTDDLALLGYEELAKELTKIPNLSAIFIPTSSGTTAVGLYNGFKNLKINPQIHIVQTPTCHPMVENDEIAGGSSLAGAIVDKVAHRKIGVLEVIKTSHGNGWVATDKEILSAIDLVKQTCGIEISPNSALAIVGLQQAIAKGYKWNGPIVCLITGK